jgi:farnesyl-diphosphate farnesyltransferase
LFPAAELDEAGLLADGVRFGKGLQLVNILRDLPTDLRQGRCYLPRERLEQAGLAPAQLLDPATEPRLRPLYNQLLDVAEEHLSAGWRYTNTLPRSCFRVRLACAWPVLIGLQTLGQLRTGNMLDPQKRIKISRRAVRRILWRSVALYPFPKAWENQASRPNTR